MTNFEAQLAEYLQVFEAFCAKHDLPGELLAAPDHVAIKCANGADYEAAMQTWLPKAAQAQSVRMDGRYLGSVRLLKPLQVGSFGQVEWLEIMEPRPEKVGIDPVGIDHMEFRFSDFEAAAKILDAKGIGYEPQENPGHQWLSVLADGREFKLTNRSLAGVVAAELSSGAATVLKA